MPSLTDILRLLTCYLKHIVGTQLNNFSCFLKTLNLKFRSYISLFYINAFLSDFRQAEWTVPHQTKLKYTQLFNTTDRTRSGFLSGVQARNIMIQSKLPQNILAQIW